VLILDRMMKQARCSVYTDQDFKTKKQLKEAVVAGRQVRVYQPNSDLTGAIVPDNGRVTLEGPHYPAPHTWYAQAKLVDGIIVEVK
jgi:hypothetical protein